MKAFSLLVLAAALAGPAERAPSALGDSTVGASFRRFQQPAIPRSDSNYWQRRAGVILEITWDLDRELSSVRVLDSYAPATVVDSLLRIIQGWEIPVKPSPTRPEYVTRAAFATDRTERSSGSDILRLPEDVRRTFAHGVLAEWMRGVASVDSLFALDDFTSVGSYLMYRYPLRERDPELLVQLDARRRFGLLRPSPDGRWVLDAFGGSDVDENGKLMHDVDTGYSIYDVKSGDLVFSWVSTLESILLAEWLDGTRFVFAGSGALDHPRSELQHSVDAPIIWVGDVAAGTLTRFYGAPLAPGARRRLGEALRPCMRMAYPKLADQW